MIVKKDDKGGFTTIKKDLDKNFPIIQLHDYEVNETENYPDSLFYKNIKHLRETEQLSQENIGAIVGKERSVVSLWERNERNPSMEDLINISYFFQVSIDNLIKDDLKMKIITQHNANVENGSKIPVFKCISDITSIESTKEVKDWEVISNSWLSDHRKYFGLKITDDSMSPNYVDGDTVIFQKVSDYENGKDCVIAIGNSDVVFKRIIKQTNGTLLQSLNSNYQTNYYNDGEMKKLPIVILGVAKEIRRKIGGE